VNKRRYMLNRNVNTSNSHEKNIMSTINVFKSTLIKKSHSVMELFFAVRLNLWGLGLRLYFVSMVPGNVECRTCCLLYITLVNSLSSASSTSSTVLWCCSERPERMPRRMTACSRFRSSAVAKPHHELAAYTSFATTTDLKMMCPEAARPLLHYYDITLHYIRVI